MAFPSPSIVPPSLSEWEFNFQGFTFGGSTAWQLTKIEGLDLAKIRTKDVGRARAHGQLKGLNLYDSRDIVMDFWMVSDGVSVYDSQLRLANATVDTNTTEYPLWFQVPTLDVMCAMVAPTSRKMPWDPNYVNSSVGKPTLTLHATDPRLYGAGQQVVIDQGSSSTGGVTFPLTFPVTFGAVDPSSADVTNAGNTPVNPTVVFTGPLTNPWIANASITGTPTLTFVNPNQTGFTVAAGDQLVVDLDMHTVLYYEGGQDSGSTGVPESGWLDYASAPVWWTLPGDTTSLVQFGSSDSAATGGTATIQWASAWQL